MNHQTNQDNNFNVLHLIGNLNVGGSQESVRTLVEHLVRKGCVTIVCSLKDGPLRPYYEQLGIELEVLDLRRRSVVELPLFIFDVLRIRKALLNLIRKHNIEIIQTNNMGSLEFLAPTLFFGTNLRVILFTIQNTQFLPSRSKGRQQYLWSIGLKKYFHRLFYRLSYYKVSGFVAVSKEVRDYILQVIGPIQDKIYVIHNGVNVQKFERSVDKNAIRSELNLDVDSRLIVTVATFKEQKGHRYLVEAAALLIPQHPDLHFLFIGDGALKEDLLAQVNELNISDNIHFLGTRRDVVDLLAASDFFVLPSLWEGMSMALIEAMAAGLPIIASEVSGSTKAIIHGKTGLLVPPGDFLALANAITELISDPSHAQQLGEAARKHAKNEFSINKIAENYLALYTRLYENASHVS